MPTVSGLGLTFNLPNYTGEVLSVTPSDTPFLSAIGGLNEQGEVVMATQFEGQTQDLGTPAQPDGILEGADAPTLSNRSRANWSNVVQIFQYAFGISYTRQAATQLLAGLANGQTNPVADEIGYQSNLKLTDASRDLNYTFINGVYQLPTDNTTGRKTRGLYAAISTNALSNLGPAISAVMEADDEVITAAGRPSARARVFAISMTAFLLAMCIAPNGHFLMQSVQPVHLSRIIVIELAIFIPLCPLIVPRALLLYPAFHL
jgi:hypothetical protein